MDVKQNKLEISNFNRKKKHLYFNDLQSFPEYNSSVKWKMKQIYLCILKLE